MYFASQARWKGRRPMIRKRLGLALLLLAAVGTGLMGCGRVRPTKKTAGAMVQKQLYQKYGIKTEVDKVYEESGSQLFDRATYQVELHLKGKKDKAFCAAVKVDGSKYIDDYSKLIYQPKYEKMVQEELDKLPEYPATVDFHYLMVEENYTKPSEWRKYMDSACTSVTITFTAPSEATHEEIAKEMTQFLGKLREYGFSAVIKVYQKEKVILWVSASPRTKGINYEEMLKEFR